MAIPVKQTLPRKRPALATAGLYDGQLAAGAGHFGVTMFSDRPMPEQRMFRVTNIGQLAV